MFLCFARDKYNTTTAITRLTFSAAEPKLMLFLRGTESDRKNCKGIAKQF